MPDPLMISEVTARCLASLARCSKAGLDLQARESMKDDIRQIARQVARWQFNGETKVRIFLRPMEEVLVSQYGSHNGRRLYWDFVDAFWLQSFSVVPLALPDSEPPDLPDLPDLPRRATG